MAERLDAFKRAVADHAAGRLAEAEDAFLALLAENAEDADCLHRLGLIALQRGDGKEALQRLERAVAAAGSRADLHADLGVVRHRLGHPEAAAESLRRAVDLDPGNADFHYNLGRLMGDLGNRDVAQACYRMAIELRPRFAAAYNNLGNVLKAEKRFDEAAASYRSAITADPAFAPALKNLADLMETAGETAAARTRYRQAVTARGDWGTRLRAACLLPVIPDSVAEIEDARAHMNEALDRLADEGPRIGDPLREVGATAFGLSYHGLDDKALNEKLAALHAAACPDLAFTAPHSENPEPVSGRPIRIGFVSSFFRDHTIATLFAGLMAGLPRPDFRIEVFSLAGAPDAVGEAIRGSADGFTALPRDLAQARRMIAAARLDILYYTDIGMEPVTYFLAFARLAPVQCVTWGHPDTTGIPAVDYFVSADGAEPPGAEAAYSETLVRLGALPPWVRRPDPALADRPARTLRPAKTGALYVCPQSLFKFHPDFDAMLAAILRQDSRGEIHIIEGVHRQWDEHLRARLARTLGDGLDRVHFAQRMDGAAFSEMLASADLLLDTPHFSGGRTTYEGLAQGTPVLTLPSAFLRGRVSAALLEQMGVEDCIAADAQDYAARAVALANPGGTRDRVLEAVAEGAPGLFERPDTIEEHTRFFRLALARPEDGAAS